MERQAIEITEQLTERGQYLLNDQIRGIRHGWNLVKNFPNDDRRRVCILQQKRKIEHKYGITINLE